MRRTIGHPKALEKKVPKNPKYAHVSSTIDTGRSMRKYGDDHFRRMNARFHRERKYKRIKVSTLGRLIQLPEEDRDPQVLLLDLRSPEEYEECHIINAISFPHTRLGMSVNVFSADILSFLNQDHHALILYCDDERVSSLAAENMSERGIENSYVLSGGLMSFGDMFEELLTDALPLHLRERLKMMGVKGSPKFSSKMSTTTAASTFFSPHRSLGRPSMAHPRSFSTEPPKL
eukprot:TRINITY_DN238_c1_g1_i2.p1 TRINITY_DN238_c1_g1~~TRINITY_DN238_c1_g1_i2.p1  ORF type:complete len:232 (-),score=59.31 TRINITY_DN238_c1_g1_i2:323-1018(-)